MEGISTRFKRPRVIDVSDSADFVKKRGKKEAKRSEKSLAKPLNIV